MFKIIKKGSNNFWHVFNNGAKNISISDFEVVLDDVLNTFVIVLRNGANIPQTALSVLDIIVIDETASSVEETFFTASQLRARLVVLGYTAYLGTGNADAITGLVEAGTNVTITGNGTLADPYVINSSGTGGTTPTLQDVTDAGNEIINATGNLKIVLDKEINGMLLYELVSGTWENRGYYNTQGFNLGGFDGNNTFDLNIYTGLLSIYNGTDVIQFSPTSATKNGIEFATEDFALKRDGSNANSDVDVATNGYGIKAKSILIGTPTTHMEVKSEHLSTNRIAQWQDIDYDGIADVSQVPTTLAELSTDNANQRVSTTEKATYAGKQDALGFTPVPNNRTINSKPLSANVTLTTADIPDSTGKRYQTENQNTFNDATSSIQTQIDTKQNKISYISSSTPYTGTTSTALQKLSNAGSSGNGSFPAKANTRYKIEVQFQLSGLSTTTNSVQFGILGTAGITSVNGQSIACKSASILSSNTPSYTGINTATISSALMTTGTQAFARAVINIEVVTSTAGTLIIAFATNVSTTPVVENHIIRFIELGASSTTSSSDIV